MDPTHAHPLAAAPVALLVLLLAAWSSAALAALAGGAGGVLTPVRRAALLARQSVTTTERPDGILWILAPAAYLGMAAMALVVVPLDRTLFLADLRTGIVWFGTAEAIAIVAVYLQGWGPNSWFGMVGGYRFVAIALSYELVSMFVLIGAALPAESLAVGAIVDAQASLWNVLRQPLGLPLFTVVALGISNWGPFAIANRNDLAGGVAAEPGGPNRLVWELGRHAMLTVFAGMAAAVFLGGWHGPWLPGWSWMLIKTAVVLAGWIWLAARLPHPTTERFVHRTWTWLLPLSFVSLAEAGVVALL